jgi:DNA polymerase-3 subunit delta
VTPETAIADARSGALKPVYIVTGDERFFADEVLGALRHGAIGTSIAAFNEDKFTAGESDIKRVLGACRTLPMMAPRRFVHVRSIERWDGAEALDELASYAESANESTCLVVTGEKLDGRRRLAAIGKKRDFHVLCNLLDDRAIVKWITSRAQLRGHAIDADAAQLVCQLVGPTLGLVNDALERLALYVSHDKEGRGRPITEEAVVECIVRVRTADVWALVDAAGQRNLARAFSVLADVYDPRDRGLPLLGALAWSVRQFLRFVLALEAGQSAEAAGRSANVFPSSKVRDFAQRAKTLRARDAEQWLIVLAETDAALKSSRRPADAILEEALVRLCRQRT